ARHEPHLPGLLAAAEEAHRRRACGEENPSVKPEGVSKRVVDLGSPCSGEGPRVAAEAESDGRCSRESQLIAPSRSGPSSRPTGTCEAIMRTRSAPTPERGRQEDCSGSLR